MDFKNLVLFFLLLSLLDWEVQSFGFFELSGLRSCTHSTHPTTTGRESNVRMRLSSQNRNDENDNQGSDQDSMSSGMSGIGRRGILKSLLGGAVGLATIGDVASTGINALLSTTSSGAAAGIGNSALAALYSRVVAFGKRNAATVASDDLLAWISSQTTGAAATAELQTWLAAQRKLRTLRTTVTAVGTAVTSGASATTSRRAAVTGGTSFVEDIVSAAVVGKAVKSVANQSEGAESDEVVDAGTNSTSSSCDSMLNLEKSQEGDANSLIIHRDDAYGEGHDDNSPDYEEKI